MWMYLVYCFVASLFLHACLFALHACVHGKANESDQSMYMHLYTCVHAAMTTATTTTTGTADLARVLVDEGGAELECRNKKGETALSLACFWGNEDTVE